MRTRGRLHCVMFLQQEMKGSDGGCLPGVAGEEEFVHKQVKTMERMIHHGPGWPLAKSFLFECLEILINSCYLGFVVMK